MIDVNTNKIFNDLTVGLLNIIGITHKPFGIDININYGVSFEPRVYSSMFEMYMNAISDSSVNTYQMNFLDKEGVVIDD